MSRLDELPPDQRAALALLLGQRTSYAQLAGTLHISEQAVHDRAHAALAVLAPALARGVASEQREQVGDYLLGQQQGVAERLATRTLLKQSQPARAWASELATALAPLSAQPLPQIPDGDGAAPAPDGNPAQAGATASPAAAREPRATSPSPAAAREPRATSPSPAAPPPPGGAPPPAPGAAGERSSSALPSSRVGGAIVLALIVAAVVLAVVLLTKGGSSHNPAASSARRGTTATTTTGPHIDQRFTLSSPTAGSSAAGAVALLSESGKRAFYIAAERLPPTQGRSYHYDIWLANSSGGTVALSEAPQVGSSGQLAGGAFLPSNAAEYNEMLLTRETTKRPAHPGPVLLHGRYSLTG